MKTFELTGTALDWAVAKCEGNEIEIRKGCLWIPTESYSTNWAQGGPIIERERIRITAMDGYWDALYQDRLFEEDGTEFFHIGATPLIAAMRCYVASKLGDEVKIPEELI